MIIKFFWADSIFILKQNSGFFGATLGALTSCGISLMRFLGQFLLDSTPFPDRFSSYLSFRWRVLICSSFGFSWQITRPPKPPVAFWIDIKLSQVFTLPLMWESLLWFLRYANFACCEAKRFSWESGPWLGLPWIRFWGLVLESILLISGSCSAFVLSVSCSAFVLSGSRSAFFLFSTSNLMLVSYTLCGIFGGYPFGGLKHLPRISFVCCFALSDSLPFRTTLLTEESLASPTFVSTTPLIQFTITSSSSGVILDGILPCHFPQHVSIWWHFCKFFCKMNPLWFLGVLAHIFGWDPILKRTFFFAERPCGCDFRAADVTFFRLQGQVISTFTFAQLLWFFWRMPILDDNSWGLCSGSGTAKLRPDLSRPPNLPRVSLHLFTLSFSFYSLYPWDLDFLLPKTERREVG